MNYGKALPRLLHQHVPPHAFHFCHKLKYHKALTKYEYLITPHLENHEPRYAVFFINHTVQDTLSCQLEMDGTDYPNQHFIQSEDELWDTLLGFFGFSDGTLTSGKCPAHLWE